MQAGRRARRPGRAILWRAAHCATLPAMTLRRRHLPFALGLPLGLPASARGQVAGAPLPLWFIFLETGRATPDDAAAVAAMQRGHIDNFKRLFNLGQLLAAGPLRDPDRIKRGIVVVRAVSMDQLLGYFQPDDYVREGYLRVNAVPARVWAPLHTEGIDTSGVEELRIVLLGRPALTPDAAALAARQAWLQGLLARGSFGAWYSLDQGPVAEVLFAAGTDSAALQASLADGPALPGASLSIWPQWLARGVVRRPA